MISSEQERSIKKIKRELETYRELILFLSSILIWEKRWYCGVVLGASTLFFFMIWIIDPSLLSLIAFIGLIVMVFEYFGSAIVGFFSSPTFWTGAKEKRFEDFCRTVVACKQAISSTFVKYHNLKTENPKKYYIGTTGILLLLIWLGSTVDSLFLTYLIVTYFLLLPGLIYNGMIDRCYNEIKFKVNHVLGRVIKPPQSKKSN